MIPKDFLRFSFSIKIHLSARGLWLLIPSAGRAEQEEALVSYPVRACSSRKPYSEEPQALDSEFCSPEGEEDELQLNGQGQKRPLYTCVPACLGAGESTVLQFTLQAEFSLTLHWEVQMDEHFKSNFEGMR